MRSLPPLPTVWQINPCLQQAINVMEACYCTTACRVSEYRHHRGHWPQEDVAAVQRDLITLVRANREGEFAALVDIARVFAIRNRDPTLWCCRQCRPVTATLLVHCAEAGVPWERAARGQLFDDDFPRLTTAAGRLAASPLVLCESRGAVALASSVEALAVGRALRLALCDWTPKGDELRSLTAASRRLGLSVVFPRR